MASEIIIERDDIWLKTEAGFRLRIGCGGAISNLLANDGQEWLSPAFQEEKTDRIIQWTIWSESLTNTVPKLPKFEHRFNITQGGDFEGNFSSVRSPIQLVGRNQIEIYATPTLNWKKEQQTAFSGGCACLTRYTIMSDGFIRILRVLTPFKVKLNGINSDLGQIYLEAWTPVNSQKFNGLALSFRETDPIWWYNLENMPTYPNFKTSETNGYAIAFNQKKECFALIFGKTISNSDEVKSSFNTMSWPTGFGILPGVNCDHFVEGSYLVVNYSIAMSDRLTTDFLSKVVTEVTNTPAPVFYPDRASLPIELAGIAKHLSELETLPELRSDHLASIVKSTDSEKSTWTTRSAETFGRTAVALEFGQSKEMCNEGAIESPIKKSEGDSFSNLGMRKGCLRELLFYARKKIKGVVKQNQPK